MKTNFTDNSDEILEALKRAIARAADDIGELATQYAADRTPVDTGRARNSITYATKERQNVDYTYNDDKGHTFAEKIGQGAQEGEVYIGSNVEYFPYIEAGSRTIQAFHPLQHAANDHAEEYKDIVRERMENA